MGQLQYEAEKSMTEERCGEYFIIDKGSCDRRHVLEASLWYVPVSLQDGRSCPSKADPSIGRSTELQVWWRIGNDGLHNQCFDRVAVSVDIGVQG